MFVRFRQTQTRLQASLIETRRVGGKVRHDHIAALGSVSDRPTMADRVEFWKAIHERLAKLSNRIMPDDHGKVLAAIHARVPMVTLDEQRQLQRENAEADAKFWSSVSDIFSATVNDQMAQAVKVERVIADGDEKAAETSARANDARDRLARIDKGEEVSGGLGKPMTYEDMIAVLKQAGMTDRDLQRCRDVADINKVGAWNDLMAETNKRREQSEDAALRAVLKRHADQIASLYADDDEIGP